MLERSLHQPFVRPLGQALRWLIRSMERCVTSVHVFPRRRAKAPWPQVQKLPQPQDTGHFAQDHDRGLAQRPGDPANDRMTNLFSARREQHSPPRLSRYLRPLGKDWTCECSCNSPLPIHTTCPRRPEEDSGRRKTCPTAVLVAASNQLAVV